MNSIFRKPIISNNKSVDLSFLGLDSYNLTIKREDQIHQEVSGNKFRKLKYNLKTAKECDSNTLLTFGGAYSNHIAATAAAAAIEGFKSIGIIRGEELGTKLRNHTLKFAEDQGMKLIFVSREVYRMKSQPGFIERYLDNTEGVYVLPEGGTNALAVKGCAEILSPEDTQYDYICCPVGTGGTLAGLIISSGPHQKVIGFSALNGNFLQSEVTKLSGTEDFILTDSYSFGGYGKIDDTLIRFINEFRSATGIQLDPIYTGKMIFGIIEMMKSGFFKKNDRILAIHTGGLQGIQGMNERLKSSGHPQIEL